MKLIVYLQQRTTCLSTGDAKKQTRAVMKRILKKKKKKKRKEKRNRKEVEEDQVSGEVMCRLSDIAKVVYKLTNYFLVTS